MRLTYYITIMDPTEVQSPPPIIPPPPYPRKASSLLHTLSPSLTLCQVSPSVRPFDPGSHTTSATTQEPSIVPYVQAYIPYRISGRPNH